MRISSQQLTLLIASLLIVAVSIVTIFYIQSAPNDAVSIKAVRDADTAAATAETAAISARKAADSTRATADSAQKSATVADKAARDASISSARIPQGAEAPFKPASK